MAETSQLPAAVYLARQAEGLEPLRRFAHSYEQHAAGIAHELVIVFKGYDGSELFEEAKAIFTFPYLTLSIVDEGLDIDSYFLAAEAIPNKHICFLNTFSRILSQNWLRKMYDQASAPGVGLVGGTGSYESNSTTSAFIQKAVWLIKECNGASCGDILTLRDQLCKYFAYHIGDPAAFATEVSGGDDGKQHHGDTGLMRSILLNVINGFANVSNKIKAVRELRTLEDSYATWWATQVKDVTSHLGQLNGFPEFPNPHIRTNVFMLQRDRFLALKKHLWIKLDACRFESGSENMTRAILREGLRVRLVGKDGVGYDIEGWPKSHTFRIGHQENLLVADNQTDLFEKLNPSVRTLFTRVTWGDKNCLMPRDFPYMGLDFSGDPRG